MDDIANAPFPMAIISAHKYTTDILETGVVFLHPRLLRRHSAGDVPRASKSGENRPAERLPLPYWAVW